MAVSRRKGAGRQTRSEPPRLFKLRDARQQPYPVPAARAGLQPGAQQVRGQSSTGLAACPRPTAPFPRLTVSQPSHGPCPSPGHLQLCCHVGPGSSWHPQPLIASLIRPCGLMSCVWIRPEFGRWGSSLLIPGGS